ncbi:acylneuraminate cytidylyltransferase family protein [soil metagenome]
MNAPKLRCLAYIPAKGLSSRLPRKNILPLGSKPVIGWSIDAARASGVFERIIVSTESEEVAAIAREYGADVPFLRPARLSASDVPNHQVLLHLLGELKAGENYVPDLVATLQPTSPLRSACDIREAVNLAINLFPKPLLSLSEEKHVLGHLRKLSPDNQISPLDETGVAYRLNGAICVATTADLLGLADPYAGALPFFMPPHRSIDIDTAEDLEMAQAAVQYFKL